jgi:hypothetical protein
MSLDPVSPARLLDLANPLDAVESVLSAYDLDYRRTHTDELILSVAGQYTSYRLFLTWQHEFQALQINCLYPEHLMVTDHERLAQLFMAANAQLWLGHFELSDDAQIQFRYTAVIPANTAGIEQMNDLFKLAVAECDRFYPALRLLADHPTTPLDVLSFAMQDIAGEG